ncbi:hypothetical protein B0T17DRAFT_616639 [Bombardia bombarda]|uniref:Uncharacterized protein n=1 Tax=Bombardia bombarda TaxID=252184 RepID=A0AA40CB36_9PEZI|nr:hypothetical protein B0T17DRAFT_616639 [Bombardia bombarda]
MTDTDADLTRLTRRLRVFYHLGVILLELVHDTVLKRPGVQNGKINPRSPEAREIQKRVEDKEVMERMGTAYTKVANQCLKYCVEWEMSEEKKIDEDFYKKVVKPLEMEAAEDVEKPIYETIEKLGAGHGPLLT